MAEDYDGIHVESRSHSWVLRKSCVQREGTKTVSVRTALTPEPEQEELPEGLC